MTTAEMPAKGARKPSLLAGVTNLLAKLIKLGALGSLIGAVCALAAPIGWPFELFGSFPYTFGGAAIVAGIVAGLIGAPRLCALNLLAGLGILISALVAVGSLPNSIKPTDDPKLQRLVWHNVMREHQAVQVLSNQVARFSPSIVALGEVRPGLNYQVLFPATGTKQGSIAGPYFGVQQSGCTPLPLPPFEDKWLKGRAWGVKAQCDGFTLFAVHLRNPLWRWGQRMVARNKELNLLSEAINATRGPIVVIGDFNTVPSSPFLRDFVARAGVTRIACGGRWAPTWRPKPLVGTKGDPNFLVSAPIDHLMVRDVEVRSCFVGKNTGSDHFPLLVEIERTNIPAQTQP